MRLTSGLNHVGSTKRIVKIAESTWREAASRHVSAIQSLLGPGLTDANHVLNSGRRRGIRNQSSSLHNMTSLDPKHPVYNFMVEYYGLKGAKGPKRLARWSPDPALLLMHPTGSTISSLEELSISSKSVPIGRTDGGIMLAGATEVDLGGTLHFRGAMPCQAGIIYSPAEYYQHRLNSNSDPESLAKSASPFLWYRSILANTLVAEPVLHCHGLHEWAMQYQPPGAPPPPSAKYQAHLPLRVSRQVINEAVERRGVSCTHVDALRFFSPAAGPLNKHGAVLKRTDQLGLEQPACVHAHMDLLKIALRLQPFINPTLVTKCLAIALEARRLDVAASPYDATEYGVGIVPIETPEGRAEYRKLQTQLMRRAEPIRRDMLNAYDIFLNLAFDDNVLGHADRNPSRERFAMAEPGGLPWRKNLIQG